jgi:micrococcal nuclease
MSLSAAFQWRRRTLMVVSGVLLALVACGPLGLTTNTGPGNGANDAAQAAAAPTPDRQSAKVVDVLDGDTIRVAIDGRTYRLRYIGINAPEMGSDDRPAEPYAAQATARNSELVAGRRVWLEKDVSESDRYGRLLRYVWLGDTLVNAEIVRQGYARAGTYPPDVKYQSRLIRAEREARAAGRGLWTQ